MESPRGAVHARPWSARPPPPVLLLLLLLVLVALPLLAAGAGEKLSSREVLARARERMAGAELGSLLTKTKTKTAKATTTQAASGGAEATKEEAEKEAVAPEADMTANTAKVMFETIRRMNPGLAPLREQLPGQQPPQQKAAHQHKNSLGSKVKAALGGNKAVTRRVSKKPLPALARHAAASSYERLRELLGDNEPQQQQPPQQVAPAHLVSSDPGVSEAPEQTAPEAGLYSAEHLQQVQSAEVHRGENSALHALLQEIELNDEEHHHAKNSEEDDDDEEPRFTEGTPSRPLLLPHGEWLTETSASLRLVFGEPSGEDEEADGRGDAAAEPKGMIRSEELTSSATPSAQRSAAERAEEAALLERLMEAYAAYAALRKEPPPFAFDAPTGLGQMPPADSDRQRAQAAAVARDHHQAGPDTTHHYSTAPHLASVVVPAAADLSPEPLLT